MTKRRDKLTPMMLTERETQVGLEKVMFIIGNNTGGSGAAVSRLGFCFSVSLGLCFQ